MKVTVLYAQAGVGAHVQVETDQGHTLTLVVGSTYTSGDEVELHLDDHLIHESNHQAQEVTH